LIFSIKFLKFEKKRARIWPARDSGSKDAANGGTDGTSKREEFLQDQNQRSEDMLAELWKQVTVRLEVWTPLQNPLNASHSTGTALQNLLNAKSHETTSVRKLHFNWAKKYLMNICSISIIRQRPERNIMAANP